MANLISTSLISWMSNLLTSFPPSLFPSHLPPSSLSYQLQCKLWDAQRYSSGPSCSCSVMHSKESRQQYVSRFTIPQIIGP